MEIKENKGYIFKNDRKKNEMAPDYKGEINVDGVKKEIALWVKKNDKGSFFSVGISEPYKKSDPQPEAGKHYSPAEPPESNFNRGSMGPDGTDDLPF